MLAGSHGFIEIFCAYSMDNFCNVRSNDCLEIGLRANGGVCVLGSDPSEFLTYYQSMSCLCTFGFVLRTSPNMDNIFLPK